MNSKTYLNVKGQWSAALYRFGKKVSGLNVFDALPFFLEFFIASLAYVVKINVDTFQEGDASTLLPGTLLVRSFLLSPVQFVIRKIM